MGKNKDRVVIGAGSLVNKDLDSDIFMQVFQQKE